MPWMPSERSDGIHGCLQDAGVDGVKIDAQSGIGPMGDGFGGGPHMVRAPSEMASDCFWWLLVASGGFWWLLVASVGF